MKADITCGGTDSEEEHTQSTLTTPLDSLNLPPHRYLCGQIQNQFLMILMQ